MTDYIIQFDLKEQNQTEHSRFLGQQSAFFFKKKKSLLRKTVQTLVIQKIFTGLFFFLKKQNKQKTKRASTVVTAMHQVQLWHSSKCQGLRFHQVLYWCNSTVPRDVGMTSQADNDITASMFGHLRSSVTQQSVMYCTEPETKPESILVLQFFLSCSN